MQFPRESLSFFQSASKDQAFLWPSGQHSMTNTGSKVSKRGDSPCYIFFFEVDALSYEAKVIVVAKVLLHAQRNITLNNSLKNHIDINCVIVNLISFCSSKDLLQPPLAASDITTSAFIANVSYLRLKF